MFKWLVLYLVLVLINFVFFYDHLDMKAAPLKDVIGAALIVPIMWIWAMALAIKELKERNK